MVLLSLSTISRKYKLFHPTPLSLRIIFPTLMHNIVNWLQYNLACTYSSLYIARPIGVSRVPKKRISRSKIHHWIRRLPVHKNILCINYVLCGYSPWTAIHFWLFECLISYRDSRFTINCNNCMCILIYASMRRWK